MSLTAEAYVDVIRTTGAIMELLQLDDFWTREAKAASAPAADRSARVDGLGLVVEEMERRLVETELLARRLAAASRERSAELEANFDALTAAGSPFTAAQRKTVVTVVRERADGKVAAFADATAGVLAARLEPERKALQVELARLRTEVASDGDLTPEEERALAELAVLAAVFAGPEALVVVEAVGHIIDFLSHIF